MFVIVLFILKSLQSYNWLVGNWLEWNTNLLFCHEILIYRENIYKEDKDEETLVLCFYSRDTRRSILHSLGPVTETERLVNKWHSSICALARSDLQRAKSKIGTRSALVTRPSGKIQMSCVLSEKVKPGEAKGVLELVEVCVQGMVLASPGEQRGLLGEQ